MPPSRAEAIYLSVGGDSDVTTCRAGPSPPGGSTIDGDCTEVADSVRKWPQGRHCRASSEKAARQYRSERPGSMTRSARQHARHLDHSVANIRLWQTVWLGLGYPAGIEARLSPGSPAGPGGPPAVAAAQSVGPPCQARPGVTPASLVLLSGRAVAARVVSLTRTVRQSPAAR